MITARPGDRGSCDDEGFTLIEVTVAMVILTLFLSIFTGAMISMFHSVNRTTQSAYAQSETNQAYIKLEREVRFASGISDAGVDQNGLPVVEFSDNTSGDQVCTELRLTSTGTLQQRTWTQPPDSSTTITMGTPVVLATDIQAETPAAPSSANPAVSGPFATLHAIGDASNQQLEIAFDAREGAQVSGSNTRARHLDVTFTALNTGTSTNSSSICSYGRSTPWPAG